jgi:hypothetical protein
MRYGAPVEQAITMRPVGSDVVAVETAMAV